MQNLEELFEFIEEKVMRVAKFKTHRSRKDFFINIKKAILNAFDKEKTNTGVRKSYITKLTDRKDTQGFAIMSERDSMRGDDILKSVSARNEAKNIK